MPSRDADRYTAATTAAVLLLPAAAAAAWWFVGDLSGPGAPAAGPLLLVRGYDVEAAAVRAGQLGYPVLLLLVLGQGLLVHRQLRWAATALAVSAAGLVVGAGGRLLTAREPTRFAEVLDPALTAPVVLFLGLPVLAGCLLLAGWLLDHDQHPGARTAPALGRLRSDPAP